MTWSSLRRLSPRVLLEAAGLLVSSWLLVRLRRLDRVLQSLTPAAGASAPDPAQVEQTARYVDALLRRFPSVGGRGCMIRSLAVYSRARRSGVPVRFHCGVRRNGSALDGHAWLTLDGEPFLEPVDPRPAYAVVFSFPDR